MIIKLTGVKKFKCEEYELPPTLPEYQVWVNMALVSSFRPTIEGLTRIYTGGTIFVKETPEEIMRLLAEVAQG